MDYGFWIATGSQDRAGSQNRAGDIYILIDTFYSTIVIQQDHRTYCSSRIVLGYVHPIGSQDRAGDRYTVCAYKDILLDFG